MRPTTSALALLALLACLAPALRPAVSWAQADTLLSYLADRGLGVPASLFGTYLVPRELVIYPFFEYTLDNDREYQPQEFGAGPDVDFRGRFRGTSTQLFLGYGVSDRIALELELAYVTATLDKSPADTFPTPATTHEEGLTDIEAQFRARLMSETAGRPELFSFVELVARTHPDKVLIGEPYWDAKPGIGLVRGFGFGTVTLRSALERNHGEHKLDIGETAVEYLKRVGPAAHLYLAVEVGDGGALDEWDLITGLRWQIGRSVDFKFDNALGISSKATDWAPQVGVMFHLPR